MKSLLRDLIREILLNERYLTLPTRSHNSWQWFTSGGDITDDEIDDEDEEEALD
jgi:hypothetical protein